MACWNEKARDHAAGSGARQHRHELAVAQGHRQTPARDAMARRFQERTPRRHRRPTRIPNAARPQGAGQPGLPATEGRPGFAVLTALPVRRGPGRKVDEMTGRRGPGPSRRPQGMKSNGDHRVPLAGAALTPGAPASVGRPGLGSRAPTGRVVRHTLSKRLRTWRYPPCYGSGSFLTGGGETGKRRQIAEAP